MKHVHKHWLKAVKGMEEGLEEKNDQKRGLAQNGSLWSGWLVLGFPSFQPVFCGFLQVSSLGLSVNLRVSFDLNLTWLLFRGVMRLEPSSLYESEFVGGVFQVSRRNG